jgi:CDP-glycerol glycerophosphotransferase
VRPADRTNAYPRTRLKRALRALGRSSLEALAALLPRRAHAVVYGIPDTEGNAVEVARWLLSTERREVVWLTEAGERSAVEWALAGVDGTDALRVVRKRSLRGLVSFLSAERAFYTHRLYLSPRPVRGRIYVNLWHGDGPKLVESLDPTRPSDSAVVAGTELWGDIKAHAFGLDRRRLLVVGNPRIDQFRRPADDATLAALGIAQESPFVVWAPTFREARFGRKVWADTEVLSRATLAADLRDAARGGAGLDRAQVVVKPHPLDADDYGDYGLPVVDDAALAAAGVGFYQLLARSAGLVTDYSSVWTDYLPLDRPVGFYCPDLEEYARARDLNLEEFESLLAGPLLRTPQAMLDFCRTVAAGEDLGQEERRRVSARLRAVVELGAAERLMTAVDELGSGAGGAAGPAAR